MRNYVDTTACAAEPDPTRVNHPAVNGASGLRAIAHTACRLDLTARRMAHCHSWLDSEG